MDTDAKTPGCAASWNKGQLLGPKPPLKLKEIWAISRQAPEPATATKRRGERATEPTSPTPAA